MSTAFVAARAAPFIAAPAFSPASHAHKRVRNGVTLLRAGQSFEAVYAVHAGFFKSRAVLEDGREQVMGFHMAGEFVGIDGIGTDRHATDVIALEDSEVCVIPYASVEDPALQRQIHRALGRELVHDQGVMMMLGTMCSEERLAAFLLNLSRRFVARGFSGREFLLRMTREEIGSYLGMSLETVSRIFSRLHQEGLIRVHNKHLCLLDMAGLKALMTRS